MFVRRVVSKGYRGFDFDVPFGPGRNVMIGPNGSGKTTLLDVIAGLSGVDGATELVADDEVEYAAIEIDTGNGVETLELTGRFDVARIMAFKSRLPQRTSLILTDDEDDNRFVSCTREPGNLYHDVLHCFRGFDLDPAHSLYFDEGVGATLLMTSGGLRYLLKLGMRLAPPDVPMLVDYVERHLHPMVQGLLPRSFFVNNGGQAIITTHSPEIVGGFSKHDTVIECNHRTAKVARLGNFKEVCCDDDL